MKNINFIVIKHPRLNFQNAEKTVMKFIEKRLTFFGIKQVYFIERDNLQNVVTIKNNKTDYIAVLDILNPIVDLELVQHMINRLEKSDKKFALCDGAIPGTQIEYLLAPMLSDLPNLKGNNNAIIVRWFSQDKYNNQFNLYKYKRLKLFLFLLHEINWKNRSYRPPYTVFERPCLTGCKRPPLS